MKKEAVFYKITRKNSVICNLCPNNCQLNEGEVGECGVRYVSEGKLYTSVYGFPDALNLDPIEKKPLFHFFPKSKALSLCTVGCNFHCTFCQNYDISQRFEPYKTYGYVLPEKIIKLATSNDSSIIAYTYTEPSVFYEYMIDCAKLAKEHGLYNIIVSNGYINQTPLEQLIPYIDGGNIDLKFFSDLLYKKHTAGHLKPVLSTIKTLYEAKKIIEVTTLIIPGLNDDDKQLTDIAGFIASVSTDIPWHISRFFPTYKLIDRSPTPISTLLKAVRIGKNAGLKYIYTGNIPSRGNEDTICPACDKKLISRNGFKVLELNIESGKCKFCGKNIYGKFD